MTTNAVLTQLPADAAELVDLFRSRAVDSPPVRILGRGSSLTRLPHPSGDYAIVSLRDQRSILRLAADDLTCSVEVGVLRSDLDAALAEHGLILPMAHEHETIGGAFADGDAVHDTAGPLGLVAPRNLLLGCEGVLAEGRRFKTGAQVVKSVAGFDLHKLFVGSRGRLFVATVLHLKLRPAPRSSVCFANGSIDVETALARFAGLRVDSSPPAAFWLEVQGDPRIASIHGTYSGSAKLVSDRMKRHRLQAGDPTASPFAVDSSREHLRGIAMPSCIESLLACLPHGARLAFSGGGRFRIDAKPGDLDVLLARLPSLGAHGEIHGGVPDRRGRSTSHDRGANRISARLRDLLDPKQVLV